MKRCLLGFFFVGAIFGEELPKSYQLAEKDWEAPVGMRLRVNSERRISNGKLKFTTDGAWSTGKITSLEKSEIIGERTSEDAYVLQFVSETSQYRMFYDGVKSNQRSELALHEKTVRVELKDGDWEASVIEGDLGEVDPDELESRLEGLSQNVRFDYSESLYGVAPREVGATWEVDLPHLPGMGKGKVESGKAKVIFEKVEEFRGEECAVLTVEFEAKIDFTEFDGGYVEYVGEGTVKRSLKTFLDLDFRGKGELKAIREMEGTAVETEGKYAMVSEIFILPPVEKE